MQELKSFVVDSELIVGGGKGGREKDDDFMLDSHETSLRKLATTTTQESASYSIKKNWAATIENNIEKVINKP